MKVYGGGKKKEGKSHNKVEYLVQFETGNGISRIKQQRRNKYYNSVFQDTLYTMTCVNSESNVYQYCIDNIFMIIKHLLKNAASITVYAGHKYLSYVEWKLY